MSSYDAASIIHLILRGGGWGDEADVAGGGDGGGRGGGMPGRTWRMLLATSLNVISIMRRGFKMHVDDVASIIRQALVVGAARGGQRAGRRRAQHTASRHPGHRRAAASAAFRVPG